MNRIFVSSAAVVGLLVTLYLLWDGGEDFPFNAWIAADSEDRILAGPMNPIDPPRLLPKVEFVDDRGRKLSLEDFRGKVVLLNIWATWCPPCREEMPSLDRLQSRLGGSEFQVLALSTDMNGVNAVRSFYQKAHIDSLEMFMDQTGEAEIKLKIPGLPTTMLIDRSGAAIGVRVGPAQWDGEEIIALIQKELNSARERR